MSMMRSLREQEEALFSRWRERHESFASDGIVDETYFASSSPRLLFVLKETNEFADDVRAFLREDGGRAQTWNTVARWTIAIRDARNSVPWREIERLGVEGRRDALRSVAVMNLKKAPGSGSTDVGALRRVAMQDADLLREQLSIYDPVLTVCCGSATAKVFRESVIQSTKIAWQRTTRGVYYFPRSEGRWVIEYLHPQAHVTAHLLCYGLVDAAREILALAANAANPPLQPSGAARG